MSAKQEYTVLFDGWCAGKWRKAGSTVKLTNAEAKYENVSLATTEPTRVELVGSLDDPTVKSSGLAAQAKTERKKRTSPKK